jgi:ATP-dependent Clp protease ATP-binding subunit ClpC
MFERYTEGARRTLFFARFETTELGRTSIEAEHLLLGLLRADTGPAPRLFAEANLSYADARAEIAARHAAGEKIPTSVEVPFSEGVHRILRYAAEEADVAGHRHIGPEHLLAGVLREEGSFASGMLRRTGMTLESLRETIRSQLSVPEVPETFVSRTSVRVTHQGIDAIASLERIRWLAEELVRSRDQADYSRSLLEETHRLIDALKRRLA